MKKLTKKIISLIIVGAMVLSMGCLSAFAEEGEANLVKTLEIAEEGVTVPEATFNFAVAELSELDGEDDPAVSTGATGFDDAIEITAADAAAEGGAEKALAEVFEGATFPHAGFYAYSLTETDATYEPAENESLTCNTEEAEYTVIVIVANGDDGLVVDQILIRDKDGNKVDSADFNNKYEKTNTEDGPLTISKTVEGDMADKASKFKFTLTITAPEGSDLAGTAAITGKIGEETVEIAYGENEIELADGETLEVTGLVYGSTYSVVEADTDEDIQNYDQYETKVSVNGSEKEGKESGDTILDDTKDNTVAFTNTLEITPPTGIIINNLPYILLVVIAAAGVIYMQMKKRV